MNMIDRIRLAAGSNGWTYDRDVTGDGVTRLIMTRGDAVATADIRHYYGRPKLLRATLGAPAARCTVDDVIAYLGTR